MKKLRAYIGMVLFYMLVWVVLDESTSLPTIVSGLFLSTLSVFITYRFLMPEKYIAAYRINIFTLVKYVLYLVLQIYISGLLNIKKILTGRINVDIVDIDTSLKDEFYACILANSITLTPGTVTVDKSGARLKVLWLDCTTRDPAKAGSLVKKNFEQILVKGLEKCL